MPASGKESESESEPEDDAGEKARGKEAVVAARVEILNEISR